MSDPIRPTNHREKFTPEMIATYNRLMRSAHLDRPIRSFWSNHPAGLEATGLTYLGAGPPATTELNASDICGVRFATTDTMSFMRRLPADVDISKDIELRMIHSNKVNTAGTILWGFNWLEIPLAGAIAIGVPAGVMDEDAAAQVAHTTAFAPQAQGWNKINGGTLTLTPGVDYLALLVTNTLTVLADADAWEIQIRYWSNFMNAFAF